jgi:hypothetical protein
MACRGPGLNFAHVGAPESQCKSLPCRAKRSQSECRDCRAEGVNGQGSDLPPARPRRYYCSTQICRGVPLVRLVCSLHFVHEIIANCLFSKESQLHILINNASVLFSFLAWGYVYIRLMGLKRNCSGVMTPPIEDTTVQKYDMQFGTNVIGRSRVLLSLASMPYNAWSLAGLQAPGCSQFCCCRHCLQPLMPRPHMRRHVS